MTINPGTHSTYYIWYLCFYSLVGYVCSSWILKCRDIFNKWEKCSSFPRSTTR